MNEPIFNVVLATFSAMLGWLIAAIQHRLAERKKTIEEVADRYIDEVRTSGFGDFPAARIGAMQRAGFSLFTGCKEIQEFFRIVTARGCTYPLKDFGFDGLVLIKDLPIFLHTASAKGRTLDSDKRLLEYFTDIFKEALKKQTDESKS